MRRACHILGRTLFTIAVLPFAIVVSVPVVGFMLIAFAVGTPHWLWSTCKWKRRLSRQGRFRRSNAEIAELTNGTLIVDSPTIGWGILHCWWTPDNLRAITPHRIPDDDDRDNHIQKEPENLEMPFDKWVHEKYLHPDNGTAILLATRRGDRVATKWAQLNPELDVVSSWSGPLAWQGDDEKGV